MAGERDLTRLVERWERDKKFDLVCEGGGVLGIGLVGAFSVLEASGFRTQNVAGTSAGAIVAALLGAGYSANEVRRIIFDLDFARLTDPTRSLQIPLLGSTWVGQALSLVFEQGLYKGDEFLRLIRGYLGERGYHRFGDRLYDPSPGTELRYRHKVQVIVSDVTGHRLLVLPRDAKQHLGIEPDELPVAEAVRMSMSIPFFFKAVRWPNPVERREHILVDGGMLSNFPVWLFDSAEPPEWPTIGIKLQDSQRHDDVEELSWTPLALRGLIPPALKRTLIYSRSLVETMTKFHDRLYLDSETYARTIGVETGGISGTNFRLSDREKETLYANGQRAAREFLERKWTFGGYVAAFRTAGPKPQRSEMVSEAMQEAAAQEGVPARPVEAVVPPPGS